MFSFLRLRRNDLGCLVRGAFACLRDHRRCGLGDRAHPYAIAYSVADHCSLSDLPIPVRAGVRRPCDPFLRVDTSVRSVKARARIERQKTQGQKRSAKWPSVRREHLRTHGTCAVCGGKKKLNVHHILPFHIDREKELDAENLITLCEGNSTINCHLRFGHWGNFARKYNPFIADDAAKWSKRFTAKNMEVEREMIAGRAR